jgi:iron complex transport system substrate-binding protein
VGQPTGFSTGGEPWTGSRPPRRVISLVPSLTESLFDLGFGETVVGVTDYCIHPEQKLAGLPRLGGPKNPDLERITALQPDLVFANQEENTPQAVQALQAAGLQVWLSFPRSVPQAVEVLWTLLKIFAPEGAAAAQAQIRLQSLERAAEICAAAAGQARPRRFFCPIWQAELADGRPWWMTFNQDTYASAVLEWVGGENVFAARRRRYPLEADLGLSPEEVHLAEGRDVRYPRVTLEEIQAADPELILLPSEPYAFGPAHLEELRRLLPQVQAVRSERLHLVDGSLITWHGTRLGLALQKLPGLFAD